MPWQNINYTKPEKNLAIVFSFLPWKNPTAFQRYTLPNLVVHTHIFLINTVSQIFTVPNTLIRTNSLLLFESQSPTELTYCFSCILKSRTIQGCPLPVYYSIDTTEEYHSLLLFFAVCTHYQPFLEECSVFLGENKRRYLNATVIPGLLFFPSHKASENKAMTSVLF